MSKDKQAGATPATTQPGAGEGAELTLEQLKSELDGCIKSHEIEFEAHLETKAALDAEKEAHAATKAALDLATATIAELDAKLTAQSSSSDASVFEHNGVKLKSLIPAYQIAGKKYKIADLAVNTPIDVKGQSVGITDYLLSLNTSSIIRA